MFFSSNMKITQKQSLLVEKSNKNIFCPNNDVNNRDKCEKTVYNDKQVILNMY